MSTEGPDYEAEQVYLYFRNCFFAMGRLASYPWSFVEKELERSRSPQVISEILRRTCCHQLCSKFPPSVRYRRRFIDELVKQLEHADCDPLDELYDALGEVIGAEETPECYKSYFLPGGGAVTLREKVAAISEGTTGLVTWEAALHLAEWALDNQQYFRNRSVLELGSGAGLTGMAVCKACGPARFTFSDCHPSVLQQLQQNVRLNGLDEQSVRVEELDWASVTEDQLRANGADTIIAADVVYDPVVVETLVSLLSQVFTFSSPDVFICSTVRHEDTYEGFTRRLGDAGILHRLLAEPGRPWFPFNRDSRIEVLQLCRRR